MRDFKESYTDYAHLPQVLLKVINLQKLSALNLFGLTEEFFAFNIFLNFTSESKLN